MSVSVEQIPIPTACPACGNGFRLPAAGLGRPTTCPFCHKRFRIQPNLGELIAAEGYGVAATCERCTRTVWVGAAQPLLDRLCPLCHAGRLLVLDGAPTSDFDPVGAPGVSMAAVWDDVATSFAGAAPSAPDAAAAGLAPGARLAGRYVVGRLLRVDRVSALYSGRDEIQDREVTLQVVFPSLVADRAALAPVVAAAERLVALGSDGLLTVHAVAQDAERGLWVVVMDPLRGLPLSSWLRAEAIARRRPAAGRALAVGRRLVDILGRVSQALSHGWLLPENVLVISDEDCHDLRILGFVNPSRLPGGAAAAPALPAALAHGIAPELRWAPAPTLPGDISSAAAINTAIATGHRPAAGAAARPSGLAAGVPAGVDAVLIRALETLPATRPASFFQFGAGLAPVPVVVPVPVPEPEPEPVHEHEHEPPHAHRRRSDSNERVAAMRREAEVRARNRQLATLGVLVAIVLLGFAGAWAFREHFTGGPGGTARLLELAPAEGAWVRTAMIPVRGALAVPAPERIAVNGVEFAVDRSGRFSAEVPANGPDASIEVRTAGPNGRFLDRRTVSIDREAPVVFVEAPAAGATIREGIVRVVGRAIEPNLADVKVNGEPGRPVQGRFSADVVLDAEGKNELEVVAVDHAGNAGKTTVTVVRDTRPPAIRPLDPIPAKVKAARLRVYLHVSDAHLAWVRVDGKRVETAKGEDGGETVAFDWPLVPGANERLVVAADALGRETELKLATVYELAAATATATGTGTGTGTGTPVTATPVVARDDGPAAYLEIPLVGAFGDDIVPEGVEDALEQAAKKGIRHVVLTLDSGGGRVAAAERIQKALEKHDDALTYHCVIKRAISASIWVVFASDAVYLAEGATVGGAVVFSRSAETGNAEVDAKMNSIIAADIAARAERKRLPAIVVRPMIQQEAELYVWKGADGQMKVALERPKGVTEFIVSDDANAVLTLTAAQAAAVGLGRMVAGDLGSLGAALGRPSWKSAGTFGAEAMERAKKAWAAKRGKIEKVLAKFEDAVNAANRLIQLAANIHPNTFQYYHRDGKLTPESQVEWRDRTDACVTAYGKVLGAIADAEREDKALQRHGWPTQIDRAGVKDLRERVKLEIKLLQANRNRETV